ncbi:MAG: Holliday junction resolvase RuvX [Deltaproteobacteria bacterium]|nr:Holliday junction resolvase RuvX [Deltaproteobacteria bacterium]
MRYMALDVGDRRIGVAVTDPLGWTVQPLATLERTRLERDLDALATYIQEYHVQCVVIGVPLRTEEGIVGIQAKKVRTFAEQLRHYCGSRTVQATFVEWDESMTTKDAESLLWAQKVTRRRRKQAVDQLAAVLLLQSYLAAQSESGV